MVSSNKYLRDYGSEMTANANYIYSFFTARGWTKNSICAMLGNMQRESTINPGVWQNLDEGNTSLGLGLVQWTPATKLIDWCNSNNLSYTSIEAQCKRIIYELENNIQWIATSEYPESFSEFTKSSKNIEYLTYAFLRNYERAGVEAVTQRIINAKYWATHLTGDGYQYFLFPMNYMAISQDEYGTYSHQGMLAMDFLGWDSNGRVYQCPYYAPCDCKLVSKSSSGDHVIWESLDKVHCADGTIQKMCWVQAHDNSPMDVGTIKKQGEIIGHTGTAGNVTGDHLHLNVAKGSWSESGWTTNSYGVSYIKNECHIYEVMYVPKDIQYISGNTHNWLTVPDIPPGGGVTKKKKNKFNFILFNKRRRGIYG